MIKKYLLIPICVICIFLSATNANAKTKSAKERAIALTSIMDCELHFTSSQIIEIYAINLKAAIGMDSARSQNKGNIGMLYQIGKAIDQQRNIELREVFNSTQFYTYEKISKNNRKALTKSMGCRLGEEEKLESCNF